VKDLLTLIPYLRRYVAPILAGVVLVVLANGFSLAPPYLIKRAIDALSVPGAARGEVILFASLVVVTAFLGGAARFGMRELLNGTSRRVEYDLGNDLFQHIVRLDAAYYTRTPTGDLMSRMTNDLSAVRMAAGPAYMYLANTIVGTAISLSFMVWISPRLTLLTMLPMLLLPPVTVGVGRIMHRRFESIQEQLSLISTHAQENLAGMRIVKAYVQERDQTNRFAGLSQEYLHRNMELAKVSGLFHPLLTLLSGLAIVLAFLLGGRAAMRGEISIGDFVAFSLYLGALTWPMIALGWVVNLFQRGAASMARINRVLAIQPTIHDPAEPVELTEVRGEIEVRAVSFRYPGTEREVLRNVSFTVPAGSLLAVVGATGSGKSTLIHLLTRLYDPTEGEVLLDGVPLPRIPLARLRAAIGVVPQDAFLFSDTIQENLGMGVAGTPEEAEARIRRAAAIAQLDETIQGFPAQYETMLGERGVNLSGGQKQRATLARAIARDPEVLILDDALSAVDTHTEAEILNGLREVFRNRTSVVVSHRVSAVMAADQIVVLEDGVLVEIGTHAELLQRGGVYAHLLHRQLLADEVERGGLLAPAERQV
jgi:ATP-binding cassette subfamily B multidrug efflux pump